MPGSDLRLLRWSLVCVWCLTAVVSVWEWNGQSQALLAHLRPDLEWAKPWLIGAGATTDMLLALWMALRPGRLVYAVALIGMLLMTALATVIVPDAWLHPFAPLVKNVPVAAILLVLLRHPEADR